MKSIKMTKPAIYNISGLPWGWVRLVDLAEAIDQTTEQTWENFFELGKDFVDGIMATVDGAGNFANVTKDLKVDPFANNGDNVEFAEESFEGLFVPAGFSMSVLSAIADGYVRVKTESVVFYDTTAEEADEDILDAAFTGSGWILVRGVK